MKPAQRHVKPSIQAAFYAELYDVFPVGCPSFSESFRIVFPWCRESRSIGLWKWRCFSSKKLPVTKKIQEANYYVEAIASLEAIAYYSSKLLVILDVPNGRKSGVTPSHPRRLNATGRFERTAFGDLAGVAAWWDRAQEVDSAGALSKLCSMEVKSQQNGQL